MKKLLTILLTLLMVFTLVGCNEESKKQEEVVDYTTTDTIDIKVEENKPEEEQIAGGFTEVEDGTLTDELKDMFNLALEGLLGASYTPVKLVATQVVAGTNYKFLAEGTKTTNPITKGTYYVTIYKDLQGNVSVLDIETIEEKQEVIEEPKKVDPTIYDYWVVFYDEYGNELQREVLKYGSVPSYKHDLPEGFIKWTYKNTGKDVDGFKPIITNTYFIAVCNTPSHSHNPNPGCPYNGYNMSYIYGQGLFVSYTLDYTYNSGSYSLTGTMPIPLALSSFEVGDWVHGGTPNVFDKCTYNHGITLPTLYEITFDSGSNIKEIATSFGVAKVPEGSNYELIDGNLVLSYNGNIINSRYALIVPVDGFELDPVSGTITGDTTITFTAQ